MLADLNSLYLNYIRLYNTEHHLTCYDLSFDDICHIYDEWRNTSQNNGFKINWDFHYRTQKALISHTLDNFIKKCEHIPDFKTYIINESALTISLSFKRNSLSYPCLVNEEHTNTLWYKTLDKYAKLYEYEFKLFDYDILSVTITYAYKKNSYCTDSILYNNDGILYHICPESIYRHILTFGLIPQQQRVSYSKKDTVYFITELPENKEDLKYHLYNPIYKGHNTYVILKINLKKDPAYSYTLFDEPDYPEGITVYTHDTIHPKCIEYLETFSF